MDEKKDMAIGEQRDAAEADFAAENEITKKLLDDITDVDEGYDEFDSIPDSYTPDELDFDEDGASSLSSLLYDEDDATAAHDFEEKGEVSFTELREQMQKIRSDAMELNQRDEDSAEADSIEEEALPEAEQMQDEPVFETPFVLEEDFSQNSEEAAEAEDEAEALAEDAVLPEGAAVSDSYGDEEPQNTEEQTEHVITIDRTRVRDNTPPEGRFIDLVYDAIELFVFTLLAVVMVISFCFRHSVVSGDSMMNTLNDGDRLIISNLFYEPKAGDIIVFDDRSNEYYKDEPIIKRVIAVGGDTVEIKDGVIFVNGERLDESEYVFWDLEGEANGSHYFPSGDDMELITVPEGEIFVLGDNRGNSMDSRTVGSIKEDSVIGKVILRFYYKPDPNSEGKFVFDTDLKIDEE